MSAAMPENWQSHASGFDRERFNELTDFEPAASHAILMAVVRRVSRRLWPA